MKGKTSDYRCTRTPAHLMSPVVSSQSLSTKEGGGRISSGGCSSAVQNYPSPSALLQPGFSSGEKLLEHVDLYVKRQKMVKYNGPKSMFFPALVRPLEWAPGHRCCHCQTCFIKINKYIK